MKIQIKDSKTLKDSIDSIKKKIMDAEVDLTSEGKQSIANALLAKKEEINATKGFEELRDIVVPILKEFDTPKAREYLLKIDELERLFKRDPRPGLRNDYWTWEKLLKFVYNIIMKAAGLGSPDVKPEKEEKVEDECKDAEAPNDVARMCKILGQAHDLIIEALDLAETLENEEIVSSELRYAIEDLEAPASELDFMGENNPSEAFLARYGVKESGEEEEEEDFWDPDFDYDFDEEDN